MIKKIGNLFYRVEWCKNGWFCTTRNDETVGLFFSVGTVTKDGMKLRQIVIGPFFFTWFWK